MAGAAWKAILTLTDPHPEHVFAGLEPVFQLKCGGVCSLARVIIGSRHLAPEDTDSIGIWIGQPHENMCDPSKFLRMINLSIVKDSNVRLHQTTVHKHVVVKCLE